MNIPEPSPDLIRLFKVEIQRDDLIDVILNVAPKTQRRSEFLRQALLKLIEVADNPQIAAAPGYRREIEVFLDRIVKADI